MAIKASATITLTLVIDVSSTCRYYKLQSSASEAPSVPTDKPPTGWTETEPSYTSGSTNSLYICDCTVYSDDTFSYSEVSKSSSYEAAKAAFNRATAASTAATNAAKVATNYIEYSEENGLQVGNKTSGSWLGTRTKMDDDSFDILDENGTSLASYGVDARIGKENGRHIHIDNNSMDINDSSNTLASFSTDYQYGKNYATIESSHSLELFTINNDSSEKQRGGIKLSNSKGSPLTYNNFDETLWNELNSISTLSAVLPSPQYESMCASINDKIYILIHLYSVTETRIYSFDTKTRSFNTNFGIVSPVLYGSEYGRFYNAAMVSVGNYIYFIGGQTWSTSAINKITLFDPQTNNNTTVASGLGAGVLPHYVCDVAAVAVGTKIYMFGGYGGTDPQLNHTYLDTICVFDVENPTTVTTLSAKLPVGASGITAVAIGTDIYLLGGRTDQNTYTDSILHFDTISNNLVGEIEITLDHPCYKLQAAAVGSKVYIFDSSYRNAIYSYTTTDHVSVFDVSDIQYGLSSLPAILPGQIKNFSACPCGTDIYLLGGSTRSGNDAVDTINVLNIFTWDRFQFGGSGVGPFFESEMYSETESLALGYKKANIKVLSGSNNGIDIKSEITETADRIHFDVKDSFTYNIPVLSNGNCDILTETGKYYIGSYGLNKPVSKNGWLDVMYYDDNHIFQIYTSYEGKVYERVKNTTWRTWGQQLRRYVLFDNDSNAIDASATLSETAANFDKLTICYRTNDGACASTEVWCPDGKVVALTATRFNASTIVVKTREVRISGTGITTNNTGSTWHTGETAITSSSHTVTFGDFIAITQVIGWK